ncbi:MAG: hypothetical protein KF852_07130 [Saprospiraceae bacterium]|nr:hypothetical protein [Saprospiraceae bacterium]
MKNVCLSLLLACALFSCEKDETIFIEDYNTFCPIHFKYWPEFFTGLGGCGSSASELTARFSRDENPGVVMDQNLFQRSKPFIAAFEADSVRYKAVHLSKTNSVFSLSFDKIHMAPGTRVSLYLGATRFISEAFGYWMGDTPAQIPLGPSPVHRWQVFIQREIDSTYSQGFVAAGQLYMMHTGIPDFERASFIISNGAGLGWSDFTAAVTPVGSMQPEWFINTSTLNLPPFEENLFAAFGFNILEPLSTDCEVRNVKIRLRSYSYFTDDARDTLGDDFECNTIIK